MRYMYRFFLLLFMTLFRDFVNLGSPFFGRTDSLSLSDLEEGSLFWDLWVSIYKFHVWLHYQTIFYNKIEYCVIEIQSL